MIALLCFVVAILASTLKSRSRLEAENALRHQLIILCRQRHVRMGSPTMIAGSLSNCIFPSILNVLTVVRPEPLVRWHRAFAAIGPGNRVRGEGGRKSRRICAG